jgi:hypothetical protein
VGKKGKFYKTDLSFNEDPPANKPVFVAGSVIAQGIVSGKAAFVVVVAVGDAGDLEDGIMLNKVFFAGSITFYLCID